MELKCTWGEDLNIDSSKYKDKYEFVVTSPGNNRRKHIFRWENGKPVEVMHYYFPDD